MMLMHEIVWSKCLKTIAEHVTPQAFKTWFEPIKPIALKDDSLLIKVPNKFFYEWLEQHYIDLLKLAVVKELGSKARLEYQIFVENHRDIKGNTIDALRKKGEAVQASNKTGINPAILDIPFNAELKAEYTFDNFISGPCNNLARNAGLAIAKNPGKTAFNPLIIHGGVGLGKTHLAHAIGNETLKNFPEKRILYTNTERFTNQIVQALKNNVMYDFIHFYQLIDLLIIDDIQFLDGRKKTQEIFFNIFNYLHQYDKQIIITSDRAPKDLEGIQDRLISRFKWGLTTDLQYPDVETRIAILEAKMNQKGVEISRNIIDTISHRIKSSIRELEGVLVSLIATSALTEHEIDLDLTNQVIENFVSHIQREITVENIQKLVADHFGIQVGDLKKKSRKREVVVARQLSMYFAKEFTSESLKNIGEHFDKDHSTVLYSHKAVRDLIDTDAGFREIVDKLKRQVEMNLPSN
jgi:chromosomal replication initiator protein